MRVELSARAERDLIEIGEFIARDSADSAGSWVANLRDVIREAALHPRSGRVVPEWNQSAIREVFLGTYRIIYRLEKTRIVVLRFLEGHRLLRKRGHRDR